MLDLCAGFGGDHAAEGDLVVFDRTGLDLGFDLAGEFGEEAVVDAGLDVDPIGSDAGLTGSSEFARKEALHRFGEVCVVED